MPQPQAPDVDVDVPEVDVPDADEPAVDESEVDATELSESEAVEPEAVEPEAVEPEAVEQEAVEPEAVEPEAAEPEAAEPEVTEPPVHPELSEYADPAVEVDQQVRRHPSTIGGLLYLVVLGAAAFGVAIALTGRWRASIVWIGSSLLAGAFFRLVLPESQAGMLHVRRRLVDVALLVVLGGALLITVTIR
ncbi:MAG TPA: DUF3017 domain-containing protein [Nocardioides sp.]